MQKGCAGGRRRRRQGKGVKLADRRDGMEVLNRSLILLGR